jgi:hypothetical protein
MDHTSERTIMSTTDKQYVEALGKRTIDTWTEYEIERLWEIAKRYAGINDQLYGYLEECQDAMLEVLSEGNDPDGMANLQRKITAVLQERAFSKYPELKGWSNAALLPEGKENK